MTTRGSRIVELEEEIKKIDRSIKTIKSIQPTDNLYLAVVHNSNIVPVPLYRKQTHDLLLSQVDELNKIKKTLEAKLKKI